jgi:hypothetical protein
MATDRIVVSAMGFVLLFGAMDCTHGRRLSTAGGKDGSVGGMGGGGSEDASAADPDVAVDGPVVSEADAAIDGPPDDLPFGPCGKATCLTALFSTCRPEGSCTFRGAGSPSAVFGMSCYGNGVEISSGGSGTGAGSSSDLAVSQDRVLCYKVKGWKPTGVSVMTYDISGANGELIATGATTDQPGFVTVTCKNGEPTTVSYTCLEPPVGTESCTYGDCPSSTGGNDGSAGTGGNTGDTGGSTGGAGGSTGGAGGSTGSSSAAGLRCSQVRGPDAEPGATCAIYCSDLLMMCASTPGVPATSAECVNNCEAKLSETQLCCRAAHLMNGKVMATACQEALGIGACP